MQEIQRIVFGNTADGIVRAEFIPMMIEPNT